MIRLYATDACTMLEEREKLSYTSENWT